MADHTRRDHDPFLDWKVRVFFSGAVLLMAGVVLGRDLLVLIAIAVLAGGSLAIALARRRTGRTLETRDGDDAG